MTGKIKSNNYSRALLACLILLSAVLTPTFNSSLGSSRSSESSPLISLIKASRQEHKDVLITALQKKETFKSQEEKLIKLDSTYNSSLNLLLRNTIFTAGP